MNSSIACLLLAHNNSAVTQDTLDSIRFNMTNDIITVMDAKSSTNNIQSLCIKGFWHNYHKASYRNLVLGLQQIYSIFPNKEWYCALEYDCLIVSQDYLEDLNLLNCNNNWCIGFNYKVDNFCNDFTYLEKIFDLKLDNHGHYLLGACVFYHHNFIKILADLDIFTKFLNKTNDFTKGYFPFFQGYDIGEYLFPTLAYNLGGNVIGLANADGYVGNFERYPVRWRPEITSIYNTASLVHPMKDFTNPIRQYYRNKRKCMKQD